MKKHNYDFLCHSRLIWLFSLALLTIGVICNILMGTELDMRFKGGSVLRYAYNDAHVVSTADVGSGAEEIPAMQNIASVSDAVSPSDVVSAADVISASDIVDEVEIIPDYSNNIDAQNAAQLLSDVLQIRVNVTVNDLLNNSSENKSLVVTFTEDNNLGHSADSVIRSTLKKAYPNVSIVLKESNSYNPIMGREFFYKCLFAILLAVVCMLVFVTVRFHGLGGVSIGLCGLIAVVHDVAIVYFTFVILRYPINSNFIAAALAVIGHSLNSTVVIFDRIRENKKLFGTRLNNVQRTNLSLNEIFMRTVSTNLCVITFLAATAVVSKIASLDSLLSFSIPMIFGVVSSCYSSLFISTSIWVAWCKYKVKIRKYIEIKKKS